MAINKYNKYNVWRRYKSYDSGATWVAMDDYEAYQTEENVEACGYIPVTYRWVTIDGTMCNTETHTLYSRTRQQTSYDRGQTWDWTEPAVYGYGDVIEENSPQCGYPIYQWITVEGATMCGSDDATKYNQYEVEKEQVSTDNGDTWTDTGNQREGKLIELKSLNCGYVPEWRWEYVGEYCGDESPSTSATDGEFVKVTEGNVCIGYDKYALVDTKLKLEGESTLYDLYPSISERELVEAQSTDCEYPVDTLIVDTNGTEHTFSISDYTFKKGHYQYDVAKENVKMVVVGKYYHANDTLYQLDDLGISAFDGCTNLTSATLPNGLNMIEPNAFNDCTSLTSITIPNSVTVIGINVFNGCSNLASASLPSNSSFKYLNYGLFADCTSLTSISIPSSVTSIEEACFRDCKNLAVINFLGTTGQWNSIAKENNWYSNIATSIVYCTDGTANLN